MDNNQDIRYNESELVRCEIEQGKQYVISHKGGHYEKKKICFISCYSFHHILTGVCGAKNTSQGKNTNYQDTQKDSSKKNRKKYGPGYVQGSGF